MSDLSTYGYFTWGTSNKCFVETEIGNYVYSCPCFSYGDGSLRAYKGNLNDWLKEHHLKSGVYKGYYTIENFCGSKVRFVEGET
jgi:hypothetical protein